MAESSVDVPKAVENAVPPLSDVSNNDAVIQELQSRHQRERLLLAKALNDEHDKQLKEEIMFMTKKVDDLRLHFERELASLKPVALEKLVSDYSKILKKFLKADESDDICIDEKKKMESDNDMLFTKEDYDNDFASPSSKNKEEVNTPNSYPNKKARTMDKQRITYGFDENDTEETMRGELVSMLNKNMLKRHYQGAMDECRREYEESLTEKWNEELTKRVELAMKAFRREMEVEFQRKLEDEVDQARILTETRMELEMQQVREEAAEKVKTVLEKVGLSD